MIAQADQPQEQARPVPVMGRPALSPAEMAKRVEELGRIILAYSEVTERLQRSHDQLNQTVESLRRELGEKDRQLERRNRLAALGEMAAGLAHEIRNPLGGIQLYASMLAKDLVGQEQSLLIVRKISGGVKHLESLVSQVLHFTREIAVNPKPTDLAEVVDQAVEFASKAMEDNAVSCRVIGGGSTLVNVDPLLMGQAILNLLLNAAEACEGGGCVSVQFEATAGAADARQFRIAVRDTGPGIPAQILDRIFNPFFTTKDKGTGLGLAIVHRIVEAHDGTIVARNVEGGGAEFEIRV
ncbi:MAG TPA: ATP-binding protein [Tepidisphaeraceae bacterium]|jgi:signal transduction histidine kinase